MRVFVYEHLTGGGRFGLCDDRSATVARDWDSLLDQGSAMVEALVEDFSLLPDVDVVGLWDTGLGPAPSFAAPFQPVNNRREYQSWYEHLAAEADWTLIVAPETGGALLQCCRWARDAGAKLLNCTEHTLELTSDKQATAEHLVSCGVPVPRGQKILPGQRWPLDDEFPVVVKPCDGAGSVGVQRIDQPCRLMDLPPSGAALRWEAFCSGLATSVMFLCGQEGRLPLIPCQQLLGGASGFEYCGGWLPIERGLALRAERLAHRALASLTDLFGFVGVNLILAAPDDGSGDVVIEINPRLTTSYIGLRVAAETNLAGALLELAEGRDAQVLFRPICLRFSADGRCESAGKSSMAL